MANVGTCFEKLFLVSKIMLVFPLKQNQTGFHRCRLLTTLSLLHITLLICGIVYQMHITPQLFQGTLDKSLFNVMQIMRVGEIMFFVIRPIFHVDRLNKILTELKYVDAQLSDYSTTFGDLNLWKSNCVYVCIDIIMAMIDLFSFQDGWFDIIFLYWTILANHVIGIQVLGFMEIFLVRFTSLSQIIKGPPRRKFHSLMRVVKLSKIHRSLSNCFLEANELLSVPLLAYTCTCFVKLAVESYVFILVSHDRFDFRSIIEYFVQVFIVFSTFLNFYLIASRAQKTTNKVLYNTI